MDYSSLSKELKNLGLEKTKGNHSLTRYNDIYELRRADLKVSIDWQIGGYINEIGVKTKKETSVYSFDKDVLETLIKNLEEYLKKYN
jgi:hypothetical protein